MRAHHARAFSVSSLRQLAAICGTAIVASIAGCEGSFDDVQAMDDATSADVAGGDVHGVDPESLAVGAGAKGMPASTPDEMRNFAWSAGHEATGGIGSLRVRDGDDARDLALTRVVARVSTSAGWAHVAVDHTFANTGDSQLEGTFVFPVPNGAIVTGLSMDVNGKMVRGSIVEKRKAERIYRKIVDSMRDPAILRWQGAGTLELRVFPIPARGTKRVVLRFTAPLRRTAHGHALRYSTACVDGATAIGRFKLVVDGNSVVDEAQFKPGATFTADVPRDQPLGNDAVFVQRRRDGERFIAVDLGPNWLLKRKRDGAGPLEAAESKHTATGDHPGGAAMADVPKPRSRDVLVLVDRSRSALESTNLQASIVSTIVSGLASTDRVAVVAADITCRRFSGGWTDVAASLPASIRAWLTGREADGASDLERAFSCAAHALKDAREKAQLVYIGDGIATWGTVDRAGLVAALKKAVGPVAVHTVGVGKSVDSDAMRAFSAATGGRFFNPSGPADVIAVGRFLSRAAGAPRLLDVKVAAGSAAVYPESLGTVFEGEYRRIWVRVPADAEVPESIVVTGFAMPPSRQGQPPAGRKTIVRNIEFADPEPAFGLRNQFGAALIDALRAYKRTPEIAAKIVAASVDFDVLSELTALLVLESEEAYKQHKIKRKPDDKIQDNDDDGPRVSGGDLESLDGGPSVSPNRIQPGDPEVRVPAPRDARSVTLTMPWGERIAARWEPASEQGPAAWVGRFLVDKGVPEGTYAIDVRVEHSDGRVEKTALTFRVDTTAPVVRVRLKPHRRLPGVYVVRAQQLRGVDARGVEVRFPDGQVVPLTALRLGRFVARWHPEHDVTWPLHVEVFAIDRALNQSTGSLAIDGPGRWMTLGAKLSSPASSRIRGRADAPAVGHDVTSLIRWRGELLSATLQDGVHAWRAGAWKRLALPGVDRRVNRLASHVRTSSGARARSPLWLATARGLARLEEPGGAVRLYRRGDGMPSDDIHSVATLPNGGVVAGTAVGAAIVEGRSIRALGIKQGLPVRAVWDVAVGRKGALWLGSSWGVYRWAGAKDSGASSNAISTQRFSVATGHLRDDWVTAVATDPSGAGEDVYIGTYKGGVTRLQRSGAFFDPIHLGGEHINLGGLRATRGAVAAATMEGLFVLGSGEPSDRLTRLGPDRNVTAVVPEKRGCIVAGRASDKGPSRLQRP